MNVSPHCGLFLNSELWLYLPLGLLHRLPCINFSWISCLSDNWSIETFKRRTCNPAPRPQKFTRHESVKEGTLLLNHPPKPHPSRGAPVTKNLPSQPPSSPGRHLRASEAAGAARGGRSTTAQRHLVGVGWESASSGTVGQAGYCLTGEWGRIQPLPLATPSPAWRCGDPSREPWPRRQQVWVVRA